MVECTALEMRHRCKPIGGSNPSLSASNLDSVEVLQKLALFEPPDLGVQQRSWQKNLRQIVVAAKTGLIHAGSAFKWGSSLVRESFRTLNGRDLPAPWAE